MARWFKFPQQATSGRKEKRRSTRLVLEALEDRLAPAVFNVTTLADSATAGSGSLRAAILASDATAGPNIINLTLVGTYKLSLFGNAHNGTNGALQITNNSVTIQKLHEEVRRLKNCLELGRLKTGGSRASQPRNSRKSDPEKTGT